MQIKRITAIIVPILLLASFGWAEYAGAKTSKATSINNKEVQLYANANKKDLVASLSPSEKLIPIFKKEGWVKVGVAETGDVGWVNLAQWHQARANYLKPDIQTFYLYNDEDSKGKPVTNVIAYKNGEKLSDTEAKKLYDSVKAKQLEQQREMARLHESFQQFFNNFTYMDIDPWFYH